MGCDGWMGCDGFVCLFLWSDGWLTGRVHERKREREIETDVYNKSGRVVQKKTKEKWGNNAV